MKFKHGVWASLLVLFLAACGTQTQLPEAAATVDESLGQINSAELEQAFATDLSAQGGWNKGKYNKFILEKVVEGKGPKDQKYTVAVICKEPGKKHLKVVAGAYLKGGESSYAYVPKKYIKCAAFDFDYFGDIVRFKYENGKKYDDSGVEYTGYLHAWGKEREYKASKFFHVKPGESKFITYNEYVKKDKTKVSYVKKFVDEHGNDVHITGNATFELFCHIDGKDVLVDTFYFDEHKNYYSNNYYRGLNCYLKESFYDDDYKLVDVHFVCYTYNKNYYDDKNPYKSNVHSDDGKHAKSEYFTIPSKGKLHCIIIDGVRKMEEEKKVTDVTIQKDVRFANSKDEHEAKDFLDKNDVSFKIGLFCAKNNDVKTEFAGSEDFEFEITNAGDVRGTATFTSTVEHKDLENCYVTEVEDPKELTGRVTFRVMVDKDRDGNLEVDERSDLRNDADTARFDAQDEHGNKLKFDVPAGSQVSIQVVDRITNDYPPHNPHY